MEAEMRVRRRVDVAVGARRVRACCWFECKLILRAELTVPCLPCHAMPCHDCCDLNEWRKECVQSAIPCTAH